jgi:HSP20 family molecular chaperone IbpA
MFVRTTQIYTVYHSHVPQSAWRPPTDVYETETDLVVQIEIAGMRDGHFHLNLQDRVLTIYGARSDPARERRAYHQMEINSGDFRVAVDLPLPADPANIQATYDDGLLRITLPKLK